MLSNIHGFDKMQLQTSIYSLYNDYGSGCVCMSVLFRTISTSRKRLLHYYFITKHQLSAVFSTSVVHTFWTFLFLYVTIFLWKSICISQYKKTVFIKQNQDRKVTQDTKFYATLIWRWTQIKVTSHLFLYIKSFWLLI